jgi:multiple sugar transport system substrate-binding protein
LKPVHEHLDELLKGRIDRRAFFKRAAAAGAATPIISAYLANPVVAAHVPASYNRFSLTRAMAQGATISPPAERIDTSATLVFRGWNYLPGIVQENTNKFNEQYSENVNYRTITRDYVAVMENFHIANQPLDLAYCNPSTLYHWSVSGWVRDYEAWWNVETAKGEMYPGVLESMTVNGKLYGLPYFVSNRGTIMANNAVLSRAGINAAAYPKTWAELYDICRQLKADGAIQGPPLLPHWFTANAWFGISWGYVIECLNTGAILFDKNNVPVFDEASLDVLQEWRKLLEEQIVPERVFAMDEADYVDAFATGTYAFSPQQIYDLKVFNDPSKSQIAGQVAPVPVVDQPWGMIDEGIYAIANRDQFENRLARDYRLAGFFGYRDQVEGGELYVAKRWAIEAGLNSGYTAVLEDPEVIAAYNSWLPDPTMLDTINALMSAAAIPKVWQTSWFDQWNAQAMAELPKACLGQTPVPEVHAKLKKLAEDLYARSY